MMRLIRSERDGGSPMRLVQMCRALNVSRVRINEKRVRRLMRLDNLVGTRRSLRRYLIAKRHGLPRYENLAKSVALTDLNQLWIADLTYVRLRNAFIFVAIILDAFSRRCIGWAIANCRTHARRSND